MSIRGSADGEVPRGSGRPFGTLDRIDRGTKPAGVRGVVRSMARGATLVFLGFGLACDSPEPLRVGIVVGSDGAEAASFAAMDINAQGGIDGRPLELRIASEGKAIEAEPAIRAADELVRDASILAVVGHGNSAASLAASQIYNAGGLPHVAPTTTATIFGQAGPFSFRLAPDDRDQAVLLARQALTSGNSTRVAIVYVNDDYGRGLHAALRSELERLGLDIVYESPYLESDETKTLPGVLRGLTGASPNVLFWLGRLDHLTATLKPLRSSLPDLSLIGSDGIERPGIYTDPLYEGIVFARLVEPVPGPALERLTAHRKSVGGETTSEVVLNYDAVMLLAEALRAGARSRREVQSYLASVGRRRPAFQGIGGPVSFDENGNARRIFHLAVVTPDGVENVERE